MSNTRATFAGIVVLAALAGGCEDPRPCTVGEEGCACTSGGGCDPALVCADQLCSVPPWQPECTEGATTPCGTDVGICRSGVTTCVLGRWATCEGAIDPVVEVCGNALDEDCNGLTDDGYTGTWILETVESTGIVGVHPSVGIDGHGGVHLSYAACTALSPEGACAGPDLRYAHRAPGAEFAITVVDGAGDLGTETKIVVDNAGVAHIGYVDGTGGALKYAVGPAPFAVEIADAQATGARGAALAVDGLGQVHLSYHVPEGGGAAALRHTLRHADGTWSTQVVGDAQPKPEGNTALVVQSGVMYLAYFGWVGGVEYARGTADGWTIVRGAELARGTATVALGVDDAGAVNLLYPRSGTELAHAFRLAEGWTTESVTTGSDIHSLAMISDEEGRLTATFSDGGELMFAHRPPGSPWKLEPVRDEVGGPLHSVQTSVARDPFGGTHVVFHDAQNGDLRHAYRCP